MIELEYTRDSGRRAYRHEVTEEDGFRLVVSGQVCDAVNISENGVAYRVQGELREELQPATLEFELDGVPMSICCNLQRVRTNDGIHCCEFTAMSDRQHVILSRFVMQCQKAYIRRQSQKG